MNLIEQIKADRDAGGDDMPTNIMEVPIRVSSTNLRRKSVDRVLAMEAALIAAEELVGVAEAAFDDALDRGKAMTPSVAKALAAYRAATGAA